MVSRPDDFVQVATELLSLPQDFRNARGLGRTLREVSFGGGKVRQLFLDCDGVLAHFDAGAEEVFGMHPRKYEDENGSENFWSTLHKTPGFYENLPLMPDAMELVDAVRHLNPIILTGCSLGGWAQEQKIAWRNKHFPGIPMITTLSKDKRSHAKSGDVLVDDFVKYKHLWEEMGGIFIHHKNASGSLDCLSQIFPIARLA